MKRGSVLASAALGAALTPLNSTMVAVALPALAADFGAPPPTVTVAVVTGYLVATIVAQMPAGRLADRLGYGRAIALGRWLFAAGAIAGAFAPSVAVVLAARLMMAAGGSFINPTAMALVRLAVPEERRARAFGAMGAVMGGAAAIGPALGAWMTAAFGWRTLFLINVPLLIASWLLQRGAPVGASHPSASRSSVSTAPFDWQGSVLIGATLLLVTFSTRAAVPLAYGLAGGAVVTFVLLVAHERRAASPVLNLALFRNRGFVGGAGVIATQNLAMYSLLVQVPFLFGGGGAADSELGLAIIAMTLTMAVTSPVGGRLVERAGVRAIVAAGGAIAALGVVLLGMLEPTASAGAVGARLLLVGVGLGLSTGPANASAIGSVPLHESATAAATVSLLRYLGAVAGTVILSIGLSSAATGRGHDMTLWILTAALIASVALGLSLPPLAGEPASRRGRPSAA